MYEEVYVGLETSHWNLNGLCEGLRKHLARKIFDFKNFLCQQKTLVWIRTRIGSGLSICLDPDPDS